MSLVTDKFFKNALAASSDVMTATGERIYNTVDDEIGNDDTPLPYILICNDGTQNDDESKDDRFESDYDIDLIRLTICAKTRADLADLAQAVRSVILTAARGLTNEAQQSLGFYLEDYDFSASAVNFDEFRPCYWQDLIYKCQTSNIE